MKLTFKRREVESLQHLGTLVTENVEAIEPGLQILAQNLNLGRTSVELAALDDRQVPVLIILGLTADDALLVRALEAYAWCLDDPDSVQRLVPPAVRPGWPPRVVFVAERLLESFARKMRLLRFDAVDCFEFRYVDANGTMGFYLDRVELAPARTNPPETVVARPERPVPPPTVRREEPQGVRAEEPRIVMLHEPKAAPRIVEPAPPNGGALSEEPIEGREGPQIVLKGLRPPTEQPRGRRPRESEIPGVPRDKAAIPSREGVKAPGLPPPAERAPHSETKPAAADPRLVLQGLDLHAKTDRSMSDPPKTSVAKNDLVRSGLPKNDVPKDDIPKDDVPKDDAAKGDLAPTWRKFLDRLTSTFDTRPAPPPSRRRASTAPAPGQPLAEDLEIDPHDVAPDEIHDEPRGAAGELTEKQRKILEGLTLPDNGELAPQWRKFLDHPTLDETKIAVVRGYLQREFPLCTVYDFYDFQRNAQVFQLQDNHGKVTQLMTMTAEFFDTHRDLEIRAWIERHRVAHAMRQAGQAGVLVSQAGLQIEKR